MLRHIVSGSPDCRLIAPDLRKSPGTGSAWKAQGYRNRIGGRAEILNKMYAEVSGMSVRRVTR
jgi:hypothetical protein